MGVGWGGGVCLGADKRVSMTGWLEAAHRDFN